MTLTGFTKGGSKRHVVRDDNPERSLCGYLIPDDRQDDADITCSACRQQTTLSSENA